MSSNQFKLDPMAKSKFFDFIDVYPNRPNNFFKIEAKDFSSYFERTASEYFKTNGKSQNFTYGIVLTDNHSQTVSELAIDKHFRNSIAEITKDHLALLWALPRSQFKLFQAEQLENLYLYPESYKNELWHSWVKSALIEKLNPQDKQSLEGNEFPGVLLFTLNSLKDKDSIYTLKNIWYEHFPDPNSYGTIEYADILISDFRTMVENIKILQHGQHKNEVLDPFMKKLLGRLYKIL